MISHKGLKEFLSIMASDESLYMELKKGISISPRGTGDVCTADMSVIVPETCPLGFLFSINNINLHKSLSSNQISLFLL